MRFSSLVQDPLQEWVLGPLDVKEEPLDMVQEEINQQAERFMDAQQNINGKITVPGKELQCGPEYSHEGNKL